MAEKSYRVIIIGGGASGMAAAVAALQEMEKYKRKSEADSGKVLLLESNDRVGKKILATGNGKCNFTHENVGIEHYNTDSPELLNAVLSGFPTEAALHFFAALGMLSREKNGYFYPFSETASTVLDVLRLRLSELGCEMMCSTRVEQVEKTGKGFLISFKVQEKRYRVQGENLIIATGSKAGGFLQDKGEDPLRIPAFLGLQSTPLYPALTKCICRERQYFKQLAGVRAQVRLRLFCGSTFLRQETGELQLTKEGISGIAVFQFSGEIAQRLSEKNRMFVEINFLPDFAEEELTAWAKKRISLLSGRTLEEFFLGVLHKKILGVCLQAEGFGGTERIFSEQTEGGRSKDAGRSENFRKRETVKAAGEKTLEMICSVMRRAMHFTTEVTSVSDMRQAQVCRGGLYLSQFDERLECKKMPGLFACGEVLNVDGECGGYNLHFAWASGVLAGRTAAGKRAERLKRDLNNA